MNIEKVFDLLITMLILDTNHFTALNQSNSQKLAAFQERMRRSLSDAFLPVITVEEVFRGRLAQIKRAKSSESEVFSYAKLQSDQTEISKWDVLSYETDSADVFAELKRKKIRIGTMDLKIAAIVLTYDGTLLTRNKRDFEQVPGLRFENWIDQ